MRSRNHRDLVQLQDVSVPNGPKSSATRSRRHRNSATSQTILVFRSRLWKKKRKRARGGLLLIRGTMQPARTIITDPAEVSSRLAALGLSVEILDEVRFAWASAEAGASPFEPITAPGTKGWIAATGVMRERLSLDAWPPRDFRNLPVSVHPDGTHAISVTSGDERTGLKDFTPTTKNPKGVVFTDVVETNLEFDFGADFRQAELGRSRRVKRTPPLFLLLVIATPDELRAELSMPSSIVQKRIVAWRERIILSPLPRHPEAPTRRRDLDLTPSNEIDVPVARR